MAQPLRRIGRRDFIFGTLDLAMALRGRIVQGATSTATRGQADVAFLP